VRKPKKKKILIIDANRKHLNYVKTCVEIHQAKPLVASDWHTGFETARREKPDAIFVDDSIPGTSPKEISEKFKTDPDTTRIPVTFLTSHTQVPPEKHTEAVEGHRYLSKALDPRDFINRMPRYLP